MCTESADTNSMMCFYVILDMTHEVDRHTPTITSKETNVFLKEKLSFKILYTAFLYLIETETSPSPTELISGA